ncbi:VOC family protein [Candidatus Dojkabacteria bacterium]|uniref:VOC family protein n=1 Tax=Candidatus Dojkabacteria bacterium TaxID=2099670 RepID=A0A955HYJ6_9BACT|nr:VOC family protein [Candidatus Dojkabacteria bacterium]MCB9790541.1 VOC family protein [Candidatus Nomurabacteria bacterium]
MRSKLDHMSIMVSDLNKSKKFYQGFLAILGYKIDFEEDWGISFSNGEASIILEETEKKYQDIPYHRKRTGVNHIAFKVDSKEDVDQFNKAFLKKQGLQTLYETPKAFPEYSENYYAVFFEDPDRIKLEVLFY